MCGEQIGETGGVNHLPGSSPRVRGTDRRSPIGITRIRFIPACAGNSEREREAAESAAKVKANEALTGQRETATAIQRLDTMNQLLSASKDEGSYQWARSRAAHLFGPESLAQVPEHFDPAWVDQALQQGMSAKERLAQQLDEQEFGERQEQNDIDNQFQQGNLDVAQGHLGVSQANSAETQRYHDARLAQDVTVRRQQPHGGNCGGYRA